MEFLHRTTRLMGWAGAFLVPAVSSVWGWRVGLGVVSGMGWAWANAWALTRLVSASFQPQHRWRQLALWVIKLPVLYLLGAWLLVSPWSSPLGFLVGFSLWFVMLVVSAARGLPA